MHADNKHYLDRLKLNNKGGNHLLLSTEGVVTEVARRTAACNSALQLVIGQSAELVFCQS